MKRLAMRLVLIVLLVGFVAPAVLQAQGNNLLTNPGFEPPFSTLTGTPPRQVAQGWTPWHLTGGQSASENIQPEYYPATDTTNGLGVPRIRSGSDAQQYFTFFATHDGGLYQRVTGITPGAQLNFSAYVYVWSSTYDDVNRSEAPGGVVVQVGIDPTGGTSGDSSNIVWSQPGVQYDAYNQYSVTATAQSSAVTVFVRTTVTEPVKNNNIYVDDASLTVAGAPTQAPTATATRTTMPPTATPTLVPTSIPTNVPVATATQPGAATLPPTSTLPPTATLPPTDTSVPASATPTQDVLVPTATPITPIPTATGQAPPTPVSSDLPGTVFHTVRTGDTVGQLAALYGSTTPAIIQANGLNQSAFIRVGQVLAIPVRVPNPATATPTPTSAVVIIVTATPVAPDTGGNLVYVVRPGDTLFRIAVRFNTTVATLARANGITNPNIIRIGQRLNIPTGGVIVPTPTPPPAGPVSYVVQPGDTLFRIAVRFRVPVSRLIQANGIADPNLIFVGQTLVIP
ncbi:MAG: LysM peptidoglycan-binding domain-containing protein [Chloroflexi bacterium]|nr:LysM peptidoglycan-binding domain-containing protein [Chloroflexota bacterium]